MPDRRACASQMVIPALSSRLSAAMRSRCRPRQRQLERAIRSPSNRPRLDLPEATYRQALLRLSRAAPLFCTRQAAPELCRCRCRCLGRRTLRARCHRPAAAHWPQRQIARQPMRPRPFPSRASTHRASSSRLRDCALTNQTFPSRDRGTRDNVVKKTECLTTRRFSVR